MRQSASFLAALGLGGWIAESQPDYLAAAVHLAHDLDSLEKLRVTLRRRGGVSRVQCPRVRNLERLYRDIWGRWCARRDERARTLPLPA